MKAFIEAQGSLLHMRIRSSVSFKQRGGGTRGKITGFSAQSRHRLLIFMSRLRTKGARATFITLTFSGQPTPKEAQAALKRFLMRIRRAYKNVSGLWRCERQARGAIHFHLLLFGLPFIPQKRLQKVWTACTTEDRSIVDIRLASGSRRILAYIAKYISKPSEALDLTSLETVTYRHADDSDGDGRVWGWLNKKALPLGSVIEGFLVTKNSMDRIRNIANGLSNGRASKSVWRVTLFSEHAYQIVDWIIDLCGFTVQEYKDSTFCPSWEEMNPSDAIRFSSRLNQ